MIISRPSATLARVPIWLHVTNPDAEKSTDVFAFARKCVALQKQRERPYLPFAACSMRNWLRLPNGLITPLFPSSGLSVCRIEKKLHLDCSLDCWINSTINFRKVWSWFQKGAGRRQCNKLLPCEFISERISTRSLQLLFCVGSWIHSYLIEGFSSTIAGTFMLWMPERVGKSPTQLMMATLPSSLARAFGSRSWLLTRPPQLQKFIFLVHSSCWCLVSFRYSFFIRLLPKVPGTMKVVITLSATLADREATVSRHILLSLCRIMASTIIFLVHVLRDALSSFTQPGGDLLRNRCPAIVGLQRF